MNFYQPRYEEHAISEVAFAIAFRDPLPADLIERAKQLGPELREFLPAMFPAGAMQIRMEAAGPRVERQPTGIVFQRVKPDATPEWALSIQHTHIGVNCLQYTGWSEVWARARDLFVTVYEQIGAPRLPIGNVSLQYINQFLADHPPASSANLMVLRAGTRFLPPRFVDNGELWHVHQGWFEQVLEPIPGNKLHMINFGTQRDAERVTLTIDHLLRVQPERLDLEFCSGAQFDALMERLHDEHKAMLREVLTSEMADRVHVNE
jgi:uncharacterized protein (TIGR04255 family)